MVTGLALVECETHPVACTIAVAPLGILLCFIPLFMERKWYNGIYYMFNYVRIELVCWVYLYILYDSLGSTRQMWINKSVSQVIRVMICFLWMNIRQLPPRTTHPVYVFLCNVLWYRSVYPYPLGQFQSWNRWSITSIIQWGWNYLSIPIPQQCNRWSLGMDYKFQHTLYWACDH